jgi:hypothetical protein
MSWRDGDGLASLLQPAHRSYRLINLIELPAALIDLRCQVAVDVGHLLVLHQTNLSPSEAMQILPERGGKSALRSVVITRRALLRRLVTMTRSFGFEPSL